LKSGSAAPGANGGDRERHRDMRNLLWIALSALPDAPMPGGLPGPATQKQAPLGPHSHTIPRYSVRLNVDGASKRQTGQFDVCLWSHQLTIEGTWQCTAVMR
jgi:hypothetical protein